MITMQLLLTLSVMLGVTNGYGHNTKPFNPTVTVRKCNRNKLVVHMKNATEGGILYILGKGPGCKHRTSESSHDYAFRFDTCKVDLSKMFRVIVQQRSYAQTASDKTVQVICAIDMSDPNSIDVSDFNSDHTSHRDSRSGADGQHTRQPSNTGPIDYIQSKGNEEQTSAKYATSPVSADEVGDSLSTWFKVAMKVNIDPPVYQYPSRSGYWKPETTPVTMTTPRTTTMFTTTPSTEPTTATTTIPTSKPTTTEKNTDVTAYATTEMSKTVKGITTTPTTTKPEPTAYKHITIYQAPYMMTTSPKSTKVVGYKATSPPTTTYDRSKQIAYDVLLRNNQFQKTLLLIADFLLKRKVTRSPHGPVHTKKISPTTLLYQLVHQYNRKADNRFNQLSRNQQQTNTIHKILQLLKKGHTQTKAITTRTSRKHRAKGHMDNLQLIYKHFQQRENQQINANTLQRLREHVSKNNHVVGHHRKHVNKNKHGRGHLQEHVKKQTWA